MKSYLRFLFLGAVLLTLLGLYNDRQSDPVVDRSESAGLEQLQFQPGFLSLDPTRTDPGSLSNPCPPGGNLEVLRFAQESFLNELNKNMYQRARRICGDISPDLLQRTGHMIHERRNAEIPS